MSFQATARPGDTFVRTGNTTLLSDVADDCENRMLYV